MKRTIYKNTHTHKLHIYTHTHITYIYTHITYAHIYKTESLCLTAEIKLEKSLKQATLGAIFY